MLAAQILLLFFLAKAGLLFLHREQQNLKEG